MSENVGLHTQLTADGGNFVLTMAQARNTLAKFAVEERKLRSEIAAAERELSEQAKKFGKNSEEAKKAEAALQELYNQNLELRDGVKSVTDIINKQTTLLAKNAEQGNNTAQQLKNGFNMLKGLALGYAGKTLYEALIGSNAQYEQYMTNFEVLLGSADKADQMMENLNKFGAQTPFELPDITEATTKLLAFGTAEGDVMTRLQQLGDLSMGNAEKLDRITNAYGKMLAKGKVSLEELNMLTEAGIPIVDELANQYDVSKEKLYDMISKGEVSVNAINKAFESLTSSGGQFFGMMEKQSQTWEGMLSTISDNINMFAREVGEESFEYLKDEFTDLLNTINQMDESGELRQIASEIGEEVAGAVRHIGELVKFLWEYHDVLIKIGEAVIVTKTLKGIKSIFSDLAPSIRTTNSILKILYNTISTGTVKQTLHNVRLGETIILRNRNTGAIKLETAEKAKAILATDSERMARIGLNGALTAGHAAVLGVVAVYGTMYKHCYDVTKAARENAEEVENLISKSKELVSVNVEAEAAASSHKKQIEESIKVIEELSKVEEKNEKQKKDFKTAVDKLNALIPDLNLVLDEETGYLNKQIDVVKDLANNYINLAHAKAYASEIDAAIAQKIENQEKIDEIKESLEKNPVKVTDNQVKTYQQRGKGLISSDDTKAREQVTKTITAFDGREAQIKALEGENKELDLKIEGLKKKLEKYSPKTSDNDPNGDDNNNDNDSFTKEPKYKDYNFIKPIDAGVTSGYGTRIDPITGEEGAFHDGIDYGAAYGSAVKASAPGKVTVAGWNGDYGNYVQVDHGNGISTFYAHMSKINVSQGEEVTQGQKLGEVGSTGRSTGNHLHWGAKQYDSSINPDDLLIGKYGTVRSAVDIDISSQTKYDEEKEKQRQAKRDAYIEAVEKSMEEDERYNDRALEYGQITQNDYIYAVGQRAKGYGKLAKEVIHLDFLTYEEKDKLMHEFLEKEDELNREYYTRRKALKDDELNYSIQQTEKYIAERNKRDDWALYNDSEVKARQRLIQKIQNHEFYTPDQAEEYINLVSEQEEKITDIVYDEIKERVKAQEEAEIERYERESENRKKALEEELEGIKKATDRRIEYLDKLKQKREEEKEDEDDNLKLERLETKLAYENDEGNIKSLKREINALNEEIADKEFDRYIEREKEKAEEAEKIETERINTMIELEEQSKSEMIDRISKSYADKMLLASMAVDAYNEYGIDTLLDMKSLFDGIRIKGITIKISDLLSVLQPAIESIGGRSAIGSTTIINNNTNSNNTTSISSTFEGKEYTASEIAKGQSKTLDQLRLRSML